MAGKQPESSSQSMTVASDSEFVDQTTGALVMLGENRHRTLQGKHFYTSQIFILSGSEVRKFLVTTPDTEEHAHMILNVSTQAEATVTVFEGAIISDAGSIITAVNCKRDSTNTPSTIVTGAPDVTGNGTQILVQKVGSGKRIGGEFGTEKVELMSNAKYLFEISNNTTSDNWVDWSFNWYEHTAVN